MVLHRLMIAESHAVSAAIPQCRTIRSYPRHRKQKRHNAPWTDVAFLRTQHLGLPGSPTTPHGLDETLAADGGMKAALQEA
jgi:hypothetical protein